MLCGFKCCQATPLPTASTPQAFAALSKCAASAGAAGGATAGGGPAPGPAPAPAPVPVLTAAGAPPAGPKASTQGVPGPAPAPAGGLRPCPSFVQQQCCAKKVDRCLCAGASSVCQYGKAGDNPLVYGERPCCKPCVCVCTSSPRLTSPSQLYISADR